MRVLLTLIGFLMIAIPALMMLAREDLPRGSRIGRALLIFLAPAIALGAVQGVPELDGRALSYPNAWTMLRLVLSGLALILPWCLYVWFTARR